MAASTNCLDLIQREIVTAVVNELERGGILIDDECDNDDRLVSKKNNNK